MSTKRKYKRGPALLARSTSWAHKGRGAKQAAARRARGMSRERRGKR